MENESSRGDVSRMDIKHFISENNVDKCNALIDVEMLEQAEQLIGVRFGKELREYLLKYGYLGYDYIELYGINARQGMDSDMVKQTLYLHLYFPITRPYVALENQGDGDYYLINSNDEVYEYNSEQEKMMDVGMSLFEYILQRFQSI